MAAAAMATKGDKVAPDGGNHHSSSSSSSSSSSITSHSPSLMAIAPPPPLGAKGEAVTHPLPMRKLVLGEMIGKGNFGAVYKIQNNRRIVAKVMLREEGWRDLQKEQKALRVLMRQPHIVGFIGGYNLNSKMQNVLLFQRYECTLREYYREAPGGVLEDDEASWIMYQLCDALEVCHDNHVVHRDVSAANVFVDYYYGGPSESGSWKNKRRNVVLADFGMAATLSPRSSGAPAYRPDDTATYRCRTFPVVTPWYRAPELVVPTFWVQHDPSVLARGRAKLSSYDTPIDIWSLGCIWSELLVGHALFPWEDIPSPVYRDALQTPLRIRRDAVSGELIPNELAQAHLEFEETINRFYSRLSPPPTLHDPRTTSSASASPPSPHHHHHLPALKPLFSWTRDTPIGTIWSFNSHSTNLWCSMLTRDPRQRITASEAKELFYDLISVPPSTPCSISEEDTNIDDL